MTDINRKINFIKGDASAVIAVEQLRKGFESADAFAKKFGETSTRSYDEALEKARQLREAESELLELSQKAQAKASADGSKASMREAQKAVRDYERAVKQAEKAENDLNKEARKLLDTKEKTAIEASKQANFSRDNIGDVSTSLGSFASVAGAFGGGAGQEALALGGDVFGVLEYIPNLKDAIKGLGTQINQSDGIVGRFGATIRAIKPDATDAQVGMAGLGVATVGIGAVSIIATQAMEALANQIEKAREEARKQIAVTEEGARAETEAQQLIRDGNLKALQERRQQSADELEILKAQREAVAQDGQQLIDQFNNANFFARIGMSANGAQAQIEEYAKSVKDSDAQIASLEASILAFDVALASADGQALITADNTQKLATATEDASKGIADLEAKFVSITDSVRTSIEKFNASQTDKAFDRALAERRQSEDDMIQVMRDSYDLQVRLADQAETHQDKLADIEKDGADRIEDLRQQLVDREAETAKRINDINAQANQERIEAQARFNLDSMRRLEDFQRSEKRAREDYNRSQLDAIINNDALSAIRNKRDFNVSSGRAREDFDVESQRRDEDFANQQADNERKRAEQVKNLEQELEAYRHFTALKIKSEQKAIEERLQAEKDAYDELLAKDAETRDLQAKRDEFDRNLRRERQAEDYAIEDARELRALQQSLENIDIKTAAEVGALNEVLFAIDRVREASNLIMPNVPNVGTSGAIQLPSSSPNPAPVFNMQVGEIVTPSQVNPIIEAIENIFAGLSGAVRAS